MPQYEIIKDYIYRNYPCNHKLNDEQIQCALEKIMQRIGQNNFLYSIEENVICKLINQSLMLFEKWTDTGNALEIAFLSD